MSRDFQISNLKHFGGKEGFKKIIVLQIGKVLKLINNLSKSKNSILSKKFSKC